MIDIRDERLFIDNCLVGDENYILRILAKAKKYDILKARIKDGDSQWVHQPNYF